MKQPWMNCMKLSQLHKLILAGSYRLPWAWNQYGLADLPLRSWLSRQRRAEL